MKVALLGYGKTTKALAKKIENCIFFDDTIQEMFLDEAGYMVLPSSHYNPNDFDIVIPSPGIPPSNHMIVQSKNLVSEYDFFASQMPRSIWVSGTNGKTTTTQMITHLLDRFNAKFGGNIGTPLAELSTDELLWVLETSSFTLHYTSQAKPDIYVLLPIREDHISWHGSFQAYEEAKLKPLTMMQEGDIAIVPKKYLNRQTAATLLGYESAKDLANIFGIDLTKIKFRGGFLIDALLALGVEKIIADTLSYDKINSFVIEPHRQEEFVDQKGVHWVNDTKATNVDATLACLESYHDKTIHLILGGDDKGVMLDSLFEYIKHKPIVTYHIGSNTKRLNQYAKKYGITFYECNYLEEAVKKIKERIQPNEVGILSPAAASLDQFRSYLERGEEFKKLIAK